jgi:hypothetical protein
LRQGPVGSAGSDGATSAPHPAPRTLHFVRRGEHRDDSPRRPKCAPRPTKYLTAHSSKPTTSSTSAPGSGRSCAVCQNSDMDQSVLPIEPLAFRLAHAATFCLRNGICPGVHRRHQLLLATWSTGSSLVCDDATRLQDRSQCGMAGRAEVAPMSNGEPPIPKCTRKGFARRTEWERGYFDEERPVRSARKACSICASAHHCHPDLCDGFSVQLVR